MLKYILLIKKYLRALSLHVQIVWRVCDEYEGKKCRISWKTAWKVSKGIWLYSLLILLLSGCASQKCGTWKDVVKHDKTKFRV